MNHPGVINGSGAFVFGPATDASVVFGACELNYEGTAAGNLYTGLLDDIRIYNYALDEFDIAKLTTDVTGGVVCTQPVGQLDMNDDCIVNMLDFAILASHMYECNLRPIESCP